MFCFHETPIVLKLLIVYQSPIYSISKLKNNTNCLIDLVDFTSQEIKTPPDSCYFFLMVTSEPPMNIAMADA